jgi:large subunit ribosomal protein L10
MNCRDRPVRAIWQGAFSLPFDAQRRLLQSQKTPFFIFAERRDIALAIKRERKVELLDIYRGQVKNSSALVFTNFRGLSVANLQSLRVRLSETNTGFMVVKNSLLGIALKENGLPSPDSLLSGPNAVAFLGEDIGRGVKSILEWIRVEKVGEVSGALLGNSVLDAKGAEALADLPSKEQVLAQVLGAINAPASTLARMLTAPSASLVRVINAHVEQQNGEAA